ncbi:MAG TPA: TIGR01777 family oxidoreductase [Candidatus Dormibacteraeota bacterium]|nr:TIGR01777 family oxidoreductase [Candidatus Dormibacteraeota bacterium]
MAAPAAAVFRWHERPGAFERLTPPWERVRVVERQGGIEDGGRLVLRMGAGPLAMRWVAEHRDYIAGEQFRDVQAAGPFAHWAHTHRVEPDGAAACWLEDRVEYALPLGGLGALVGGGYTRRKLARMFRYRHRLTAADVAAHTRMRGGGAMKILVTGASGLIGSTLVPFLTTGGHQVIRLSRGRKRPGTATWDPDKGTIDRAALEGLDAVVHLAGENISEGRWTAEKKARIHDSRVNGTRLLCETLAALKQPPVVLVAASAIGFYGDRGRDVVDEDSAPGAGFLADVCKEWEAATAPAAAAGIRVVNMRFGVVLSGNGGALASMLTPFKLGAGGPVGGGEQYMSWVAVDDTADAILFALTTPSLSGPVNAVAPNPVVNAEFARTLGKVLSRPAIVPLPAFAVRLLLGEMGDELLLSSTRVEPHRLRAAGFTFRFPDLEPALRYLLGR